MRHRASLLLFAALLTSCAACGSDDPTVEAEPPRSTTTEAPATTVVVPIEQAAALFPLTGLGTSDAAAVEHAAVVAKVDNGPDARPHVGINRADLVFEIRVEGYTRFIEVFHSDVPDAAGPIRSARAGDVELISALNQPLLAWSGGNPTVMGEVMAADRDGFVRQYSPGTAPDAYWRAGDRKAPSNLLVNPQALLALEPDATKPGKQFSYLDTGESVVAGGVAVAGVTVDFGADVLVDWVWDAQAKGWARFQVDALHPRDRSAVLDSDGVQVMPANVVILFTPYRRSDADARSPQALTVGSGDGVVLVDGQMVPARWERTAGIYGYSLTTPDGLPIELTRGRTWVALPTEGDNARPFGDELAQQLLASRD